MFDLLLKVLDKLIDLAKYRQASDRRLFEDFVSPTIAAFEALHVDYLQTFRTYHDLVVDPTIPLNVLHPVLAKIEQDSLYSDQLRAKVATVWNFRNDDVIGVLASRIVDYIGGEHTFGMLQGRHPINAHRRFAFDGLRNLFESDVAEADKRAEALAVIDVIARRLQIQNALVLGEEAAIKVRLLDKRIHPKFFSDLP